MPRYSPERKQAVIAKMLPPHNLSPKAVSEQEGISLGTLYKWRKEARTQGSCLPDADAGRRFRLAVHAYCLMPNPYLLRVRPPLGNLSRARRPIDGLDTQRPNRLAETGI